MIDFFENVFQLPRFIIEVNPETRQANFKGISAVGAFECERDSLRLEARERAPRAPAQKPRETD